jgi:hypothetical protein
MQKLALTFSFASRHLPTPTQLTSVLPITNLIVATNMGGTVEEIDYLREYAAYYQVPIFIHDHLFQGTDSSRSYTITRLSEAVQNLAWKPEDIWVLWLEPSFMLEVSDRFHKGLLNRDLLSIPMIIDGKHLTDKLLFRLSTPFSWHGPYLETPMWDTPVVTTGWTDYLRLIHIGKGEAWKMEQYSKYNQYACVHENYVRQRDHSFKWIFLTAQYYTKTASLVTSDAEIHYMEEKAKSYLNQVIRSAYAQVEHRLYALWNIYLILQTQQKPWAEVQEILLRIYNLAPNRSQAIKQVLHHYILQEEWNIAYLFSKFAITTYIRKFTEDPDLELQEWHRYVKGHLPHAEEATETNTTKETTWSQHLEGCLKVLASSRRGADFRDYSPLSTGQGMANGLPVYQNG